MSLYPFSLPFFLSSPSFNLCKRTDFLSKASMLFSPYDFKLFSDVLCEWESCVLLDHCFSKWRNLIPNEESSDRYSFHVLSFNVRGLDLRWQEVLLLSTYFTSDVVILFETGNVDLSFYEKIFSSFQIFYQWGENRNSDVLMLVRYGISVTRVECRLPNVCVIDISGDEIVRLMGVYAPVSKSWTWDNLSPFLSLRNVFCLEISTWILI